MRRAKMMKFRIERDVARRQNRILEKVISTRKTLFSRTLVHQKIAQMKIQKKSLVKLSSWHSKRKTQK